MYKKLTDIPREGRGLVERLINEGIIIEKNGEINLEKTVYKILIILARIGII